jgi:restriction endonuclease S subunit
MTYFSIIQKSQFEGAMRIDAEYYQPEFLDFERKIKKHENKKLGDICDKITDGSHQTPEYQKEGVPFIMVRDVSEQQINFNVDSFITSEFDNGLKHCKPQGGDILLTKVGSVGISSVVPDDCPSFNIFVSVAVLKGCNELNNYYLSTFLNSKFGRFQAIRSAKGITQPDLHLEDIRNFLIPLVSRDNQEKIKNTILESIDLFATSKNLYQQAEDLLLEKLELKNLEKDEKLFSIINLSEVENANRLDAEYFQVKYEKLIEKIRKKSKKLEDFITKYSTGYPYKSENYLEEGIPLVRINNIKSGVIDLEDTAYLSEKDFSISPRDTAKSGDIVLSMSGTIGMTAEIPENIPKCAVNQRILKFTAKNIDKSYLILLLNSIVGKCQLERIGTGGVQTNISYKDIKNILIPILPKEIQQKIAELIQKSHEARKKSKELLEEAKRKVEEMIEKGGEN